MTRITFFFAAALIAVGVFFYFDSGRASVTALIPAFIGIALAICAWIGRNPKLRMHVMHVAVLLSIATIGATAKAVPAFLSGTRDGPTTGKTMTCLLALALLVLQIRSFIQARKNRKAAATE